MNAADLLAAVLLAGLGAARAWAARQAWRDPAFAAKRPPTDPLMAPFGGTAVKGAARAIVAQAIILLSAAWLLAALAVASAFSGSPAAVIRAAGGVVGVTGVLLGTVTGLTIILFNRPLFLVPPSARQDGGVLARR
jgi:hypothetical protein